MLAFVSYARADEDAVLRLKRSLELMGCQVWLDLHVPGGQAWWAEILASIRACDLFIAVVSEAALQSAACAEERRYAGALKKSILPVRITGVPIDVLPAELSVLNVVDYTETDDEVRSTLLTRAVLLAPPSGTPPQPLPPEPAVPFSRLAGLAERIRAPQLDRDAQLAIVGELRAAIASSTDRIAVLELARALGRREDLLAVTADQLSHLGGHPGATGGGQRPPTTLSTSPASPTSRSPRLAAPLFTIRRRRFLAARPDERSVHFAHTAQVWDVAFSPDCSLLVTASADGTARQWTLPTGDHIRTLSGHSGHIYSVAFSADGSLLATAGGDGAVILWDPATGEQVRRLVGPADVLQVALDPDGRLLATACVDDLVRLWAPTGEHIGDLAGHTGPVYSVAFSPDGASLASASEDRTVRIFNLSTGELVRTLTGHTGTVNWVTYSPDGSLLATASGDRTARLWNPATGAYIRSLGHRRSVRRIAFDSKGATVATITSLDRTIRFWDSSDGASIGALAAHGESTLAVAFSSDGTRLATGGYNNCVQVWSWERDVGAP